MSQPGLMWFLARLEEAHKLGQPPDPAWICREHPDFLPIVTQALTQLGLVPNIVKPTDETLIGGRAGQPTSPQADATLMGNSTESVAVSEGATPPSYQILDILGRGGMGVVYRARQVTLDRTVALKMILSGSHADREEQARFLNEAETIAAIAHPGIVQVYEFGTYQGLPFLAMEYCPGGSLAQKLAGSVLAQREAAKLLLQLARAMQAAHSAGIVHRDLKPGNILFARDGTARITDFGLAKRVEAESDLTRTGTLLGTPAYMAPEQAASSKHTGPSADIYALGAILYECLTGRPPFKGATAFETLQQVLSTEPVSVRHLQPRVARDLETICHKALQKEPERRYSTAEALADDLARFLDGVPVQARPVGPVERAWKWARRRPVVSSLFLAFVLSLITGMIVSSSFAYIAHQRANLAREREIEARNALDAAGQIAALLTSNILAPVQAPQISRDGIRIENLTPDELSSIEDLASLPKSIGRVTLLRRLLADRSTARKLSWGLKPILRALIQLDLDLREETLLLVRPIILDDQQEPVVRLVSARIAGRLCETSKPTARIAAEVMLAAMKGDYSPGERVATLIDLLELASQLDSSAADWLSRAIIEESKTAPIYTLEVLVRIYRTVTKPEDTQTRDRQLASHLRDRLLEERTKDMEGMTTWYVLHAFAQLGNPLTREDSFLFLTQVLAVVTENQSVTTIEAATNALVVLRGKLSGDQSSAAAMQLVTLALTVLPTATDLWLLEGLHLTLGKLVPMLDSQQMNSLSGPVLKAIQGVTSPMQLLILGNAWFARTPPRADLDLKPQAVALMDRIALVLFKVNDVVMQEQLADLYTTAVMFLSPAEIHPRLAKLHKLFDQERKSHRGPFLAVLVAPLLKPLPPAERSSAFEDLTKYIAEELDHSPNQIMLGRFARILANLATIDQDRVQPLIQKAMNNVERLQARATVPADLLGVARAIDRLGEYLPATQRREKATALIDRLLVLVQADSPILQLRISREIFHSLREWIDPSRKQKTSERFAEVIVRQVAQAEWVRNVRTLLESVTEYLNLQELVDQLRQPSCVGVAERIVLAAISREVDHSFKDIWDLVEWLKVNRPEISLDSPLKMTGRLQPIP